MHFLQLERCQQQQVPAHLTRPQHHSKADLSSLWFGNQWDKFGRPTKSGSVASSCFVRQHVRNQFGLPRRTVDSRLLARDDWRQSVAALPNDRTPKSVTYCSQHFRAAVSSCCAKQCTATRTHKPQLNIPSAVLKPLLSRQNPSPVFTSPGLSNTGLIPTRQRKVLEFRPLAKSTVEDTVTVEKARSQEQAPIPTFEDFVAAATEKGVTLSLSTLGPVFWIEAKAAVDGVGGPAGKLLGSVNGFVLPWPGGSILHLDTMRVAR